MLEYSTFTYYTCADIGILTGSCSIPQAIVKIVLHGIVLCPLVTALYL